MLQKKTDLADPCSETITDPAYLVTRNMEVSLQRPHRCPPCAFPDTAFSFRTSLPGVLEASTNETL